MMLRIIGLTGGIACGKSTVSVYVAKKGIPVIDCDLISKELMQNGKSSYNSVINTFGKNILDDNMEIDRSKLASIVFADHKKLELLNNAVHPCVIAEVQKRLEECEKRRIDIVFVDAPLLIEANMLSLVTEVWLITAPEELQLQRAILRDSSDRTKIQARISNQMPQSKKLEYATHIIDNSSGLDYLYAQIDKLL